MDCATGLCTDGVCDAPGVDGAPCEQGVECQTGFCLNGLCHEQIYGTIVATPAPGVHIGTVMALPLNVTDPSFQSVECFFDNMSLGVSTDPNFATTISLQDQLDGDHTIVCVVTTAAAAPSTYTVPVTVHNWSEDVHPGEIRLDDEPDGGRDEDDEDDGSAYVRMTVLNNDPSMTSARDLLLPIDAKDLAIVLPGVAPIPVVTGREVESDELKGVALRVPRAAFLSALQEGITFRKTIDPTKPLVVSLYAGSHLIGSDTVVIRQTM
jgi:hypothetical protein